MLLSAFLFQDYGNCRRETDILIGKAEKDIHEDTLYRGKDRNSALIYLDFSSAKFP